MGDQNFIALLNSYPVKAGITHIWKSKPSGSKRHLVSPDPELKAWLRLLNHRLQARFPSWPPYVHGGVEGRSYVTFARVHIAKPCLVTLDITKCFDSIEESQVEWALAQYLELPAELAHRVAERTCLNGHLVQGFPTSSFLCNLYLLKPLDAIWKKCEPTHLSLGSYVDDIAISGMIISPADLINDVAKELSRARLKTKKAKVRVMTSSQQQVLCGLMVNKRLTLAPETKQRLFSEVSHKQMSVPSLNGWLANLQVIDPVLEQRLRLFAIKNRLLPAPLLEDSVVT